MNGIRAPIVVLGSGDIGSAVAHAACAAGAPVVLIDAADPPWPRRGMAFVDAWYVGATELDGVSACFCASIRSIPVVLDRADRIAATTWSWQGVATALGPVALVDARVAKRSAPAMLKDDPAATMLTIGLGPHYCAGVHVDVAVETAWGDDLGAVIERGETRPLAGEPRALGGAGRERYVYAPRSGRFRTSHAIGDRVAAGETIAALDREPMAAPLSGVLRGLSANGARVAAGQKVIEVDPRGDPASCFGVGERPRRIAAGVMKALAQRALVADPVAAAVAV